jgi:hypothetical protein
VTDAATISAGERRRFLAPLALAQFICSFAGSNMKTSWSAPEHARRRPQMRLTDA